MKLLKIAGYMLAPWIVAIILVSVVFLLGENPTINSFYNEVSASLGHAP